ncbi:guanine-1-methyltransferase-domain-containing protein [Halteromyces radiatus]|uniref:guanine-1-methyltransferase-domain-containing protein n=1 Tax=Halteromyces radiatus TaxID=101107 RepID=UPI00221F205B|nr:guanine-1-methyltransferase-domain-containing protein [Halteromyces radiatus]KAI8085060.1 guanine-1-methyltransferase-domain-containing protein [Halteromyces radiatus]
MDNVQDKSLPRTYNGITYTLDEPRFKGLSKNAIKRLLKDQLWELQREARTKKQRAKSKQKSQEKRQLIEQGVLPPPPKRTKTSDMVLGNRKIVFDCSFSSYMTRKEIDSMQAQLVRCYSANRLAKEAMHMTISGYDEPLKEVFEKKTNSYNNWLNVDFDTEPYENRFDKEKLVYLSADSDNVVDELEEDKIYIIGGIVDKNRHKGLCQNKATNQGIATAQLPIGQYLQLASRKVLTVNQVYEIMLKWVEHKDWEKAFLDIIPQRKLKDSKLLNNQETSEVNKDETEDTVDQNQHSNQEDTNPTPDQDNLEKDETKLTPVENQQDMEKKDCPVDNIVV